MVAVVVAEGCVKGGDYQVAQGVVPQGVEGALSEDSPLGIPEEVAVVCLVLLEGDASDDARGSHAIDSLGADPHDGIFGCRDAVESEGLGEVGGLLTG